jgi:2-hydroxychromene-2-carboxylate isomerase
VRALREQVAPDLLTGFSRATFAATSLPALALTSVAYDLDDSIGEGVALALRSALFEDGRDIADPYVLGDVAQTFDVAWSPGDGAERVLDEWSDGASRGVVGSPHFFIGDEGWFCPMLDLSHDDRGFRIAEDGSALDSLLERAVLS